MANAIAGNIGRKCRLRRKQAPATSNVSFGKVRLSASNVNIGNVERKRW